MRNRVQPPPPKWIGVRLAQTTGAQRVDDYRAGAAGVPTAAVFESAAGSAASVGRVASAGASGIAAGTGDASCGFAEHATKANANAAALMYLVA